ncbi:hypothetical protein [Georgenia faecalis]|uniref:Integral membrane protein n=1 Tax=Georgenia faecalis TaxID=2483799 RepID=A0ABV9D9P1_9MICO|nr:hypothetical protein [Georgenia faecalis]
MSHAPGSRAGAVPPREDGAGGAGAASRRPVLLRWGLPRDPRAVEHILGFVIFTVLTIVVTRAYLQLTGFPQVGGATLHIAHVLWGGLLMAVALVLALSFIGPVVRPAVAFFGGVGFGLFIDEVGKFLTKDNDYFYRPAPMIMYVTLMLVMVAADFLHGRRAHAPSEYLAGAADHAVAGVAGGLSPERRADAEELLAQGRAATGAAEVEALLAVVPEDHAELPDPIESTTTKIAEALRGLVRQGWTTGVSVALLAAVAGIDAAVIALAVTGDGDPPRWAVIVALGSLGLSVLLAGRGVMLLRRDRAEAFQWLRVAIVVNLLITLVALFRLDPWPACLGMAVAVVALVVVGAERGRLTRGVVARGGN